MFHSPFVIGQQMLLIGNWLIARNVPGNEDAGGGNTIARQMRLLHPANNPPPLRRCADLPRAQHHVVSRPGRLPPHSGRR
jgi:hypothetical protein